MIKVWFYFLVLLTPLTHAFDYPGSHKSFAHTKYLSLGVGSGYVNFHNQKGVDFGPGFAIKFRAGHAINKYFEVAFTYQYSNFAVNSPDPLNNASAISTYASMNQESIQLYAYYPKWFVQPYVSSGIGGYSMTGMDRSTALSFPFDVFIPLNVGVKTYFHKNIISFDTEFGYQWIMGENQEADTLNLLNVSEVALNAYHLTGVFTFHIF